MPSRKLRSVTAILIALTLSLAQAPEAVSAEMVPPGNRNASQPEIPAASKRRTQATKSTFDAKYERIRDLIADDKNLRQKIVKVSKLYGIDPIHIVGALVGEHTYNVDAYDHLQTYYVKAISYAGERFRFEHKGESVVDFIKRPEFDDCDAESDSARLWTCREAVWEKKFRGRKVADRSYPDDRFGAVFFQPFFAGQSFGLGQLNPLTALTHTDRVSKVSRLRKLNPGNAAEVYKAIMDPDSTLAYMAATIVDSIENYREIAGFDISGNPGLTSTLYNIGNPERRAQALAEENRKRKSQGLKPKYPSENYYGWLVNTHEDELRAIIDR
ncbi:MAG: DUF1402 family protein [Hoeflea sp.]|uniref:DUF1402 family protein n=1 Tax=Hoeflea sp. TaxID=1940281 RepID=UPI002730E72F|nr:DUF1402 family protein [Hoeflea sp.]MDP2120263.1 DUF1402 family protein [Hoeflea sp.]MDP3525591.1 DUF1402 family protein [Hoeflea sp.]MDZ7602913.1 DUF1402 family protein [Hoeflea sp.]